MLTKDEIIEDAYQKLCKVSEASFIRPDKYDAEMEKLTGLLNSMAQKIEHFNWSNLQYYIEHIESGVIGSLEPRANPEVLDRLRSFIKDRSRYRSEYETITVDKIKKQFEEEYERKFSHLSNCWRNFSKYLAAEEIPAESRVVVNSTKEGSPYPIIYIRMFVFSGRYLVKLAVNEKGLASRTEHLVKRDIKRVAVANDHVLYVYFHGHYEPFSIELDSYEEAVRLQRELTSIREVIGRQDVRGYRNRDESGRGKWRGPKRH